MTIKQCWEWAVFDQLLNAPSGSVSANSAIRMATFAMRLLQAESSPGICERLYPGSQGEDAGAAGVISPHSAAGWSWPARRRPKGLPGQSNNFSLTQMASGNHALVEHGEDHELLLMDDVIANMTGVGKTRNIQTHIRPGFAARWGLCKPLYRPTKFGQIPLRLGGAPLAYGESTNVEQIRLIVRR